MTPPSRQGVRGRWVVLGVILWLILWLILASSITLEQGNPRHSGGSAATLAVIGILVLLAVCRVALIPLRGIGRRVSRWAAGRYR